MNKHDVDWDDLDFAVFEAVCGVLGEIPGDCDAGAQPLHWRIPANGSELPCTRPGGHAGDHVAAHVDGRVLARWP